MSDKTYTRHPEALDVALELTAMIVNEVNKSSETRSRKDLDENPEDFILNVFERCLHVANDGHVRTAHSAQNDDLSNNAEPQVYL